MVIAVKKLKLCRRISAILGIARKIIFEQRPEGSKKVNHMDMEKSIPRDRKHKDKPRKEEHAHCGHGTAKQPVQLKRVKLQR